MVLYLIELLALWGYLYYGDKHIKEIVNSPQWNARPNCVNHPFIARGVLCFFMLLWPVWFMLSFFGRKKQK